MACPNCGAFRAFAYSINQVQRMNEPGFDYSQMVKVVIAIILAISC